jgi:hypothetical protein
MSVTSIKELPEQVLSSKSSNVTVETKTRDTLKLALGMSLGLTIFTSTVLAFKIYQHLKEKRDSK